MGHPMLGVKKLILGLFSQWDFQVFLILGTVRGGVGGKQIGQNGTKCPRNKRDIFHGTTRDVDGWLQFKCGGVPPKFMFIVSFFLSSQGTPSLITRESSINNRTEAANGSLLISSSFCKSLQLLNRATHLGDGDNQPCHMVLGGRVLKGLM